MKLAIIGGAGVRVPLLTNGLFREETAITVDELSLFDTNTERATTIARISEAMARRAGGKLRVSLPRSLDDALEGCSFVVSSIRVGGINGRIRDERIALEHGLPGQETVGPGGFALALRTIPVLVDYGRRVAEHAPQAWMINFTNPVGIMGEAFIREGISARCIGVCDTPREQFLHVAEALGIPLEAAYFDYLGLNHLGWIRAVLVQGRDVLQDLMASDEALDRAYPLRLFSKSLLRTLRLLPTEYLFYYYSTREAFRRTAESGNTRGGLIRELEGKLMQSVSEAGQDERRILAAYDLYLAGRNASYMAIETGGSLDAGGVDEARANLYQSAAGYERIAPRRHRCSPQQPGEGHACGRGESRSHSGPRQRDCRGSALRHRCQRRSASRCGASPGPDPRPVLPGQGIRADHRGRRAAGLAFPCHRCALCQSLGGAPRARREACARVPSGSCTMAGPPVLARGVGAAEDARHRRSLWSLD